MAASAYSWHCRPSLSKPTNVLASRVLTNPYRLPGCLQLGFRPTIPPICASRRQNPGTDGQSELPDDDPILNGAAPYLRELERMLEALPEEDRWRAMQGLQRQEDSLALERLLQLPLHEQQQVLSELEQQRDELVQQLLQGIPPERHAQVLLELERPVEAPKDDEEAESPNYDTAMSFFMSPAMQAFAEQELGPADSAIMTKLLGRDWASRPALTGGQMDQRLQRLSQRELRRLPAIQDRLALLTAAWQEADEQHKAHERRLAYRLRRRAQQKGLPLSSLRVFPDLPTSKQLEKEEARQEAARVWKEANKKVSPEVAFQFARMVRRAKQKGMAIAWPWEQGEQEDVEQELGPVSGLGVVLEQALVSERAVPGSMTGSASSNLQQPAASNSAAAHAEPWDESHAQGSSFNKPEGVPSTSAAASPSTPSPPSSLLSSSTGPSSTPSPSSSSSSPSASTPAASSAAASSSSSGTSTSPRHNQDDVTSKATTGPASHAEPTTAAAAYAAAMAAAKAAMDAASATAEGRSMAEASSGEDLANRFAVLYDKYVLGPGWRDEGHEGSPEVQRLKRLHLQLVYLVKERVNLDASDSFSKRQYEEQLANAQFQIQNQVDKRARLADPGARSALGMIGSQLLCKDPQGVSEMPLNEETVERFGKYIAAGENWELFRAFFKSYAHTHAEAREALKIIIQAELEKDDWWVKPDAELTTVDRLERQLQLGLQIADEAKIDMFAEMDPFMQRFLTELDASGYSQDVIIKYYLHPIIGPKIRRGEFLDAAQGLHLLEYAQQSGLGGFPGL